MQALDMDNIQGQDGSSKPCEEVFKHFRCNWDYSFRMCSFNRYTIKHDYFKNIPISVSGSYRIRIHVQYGPIRIGYGRIWQKNNKISFGYIRMREGYTGIHFEGIFLFFIVKNKESNVILKFN